jgi:FkbM family methyltransferase
MGKMIQVGSHAVPEDWPVQGEAGFSFKEKLYEGFFGKYMSGSVVIDIGFRGCYANSVPILPHAIGVDVDYPGYDGINLPFADGSVDTVYSSHMLEHVADYRVVIRDWYRVLKSGGFIVCIVPHQFLYEKKHELPSLWNSDHKRFYTPSSLLREFEESLDPNSYRIRHLRDNDQDYNYTRGPYAHASGRYEIELVIQKTQKPDWDLLGAKRREADLPHESGDRSREAIPLDPESVVAAMYRALLLREPDEHGFRAHSARLKEGVTPEAMLRDCAMSSEFSQNLPRFYREYLDRERTRFVLDSSQYGEIDLLVRRIIDTATAHRTVVDVGARGRDGSNSYDLVRFCGWRGLLIEANPALIGSIEEEFSGLDVRVVHCAVSDYEGSGMLYIGANDRVSSLSEVNARHWGEIRGRIQVPIRRLAGVLAEYAISLNFDLLSLGIEGEDIKVLNDLISNTPYRPVWIIIKASFGFATNTLYDLPFCGAVRNQYEIVDRTVANLILKKLTVHRG